MEPCRRVDLLRRHPPLEQLVLRSIIGSHINPNAPATKAVATVTITLVVNHQSDEHRMRELELLADLRIHKQVMDADRHGDNKEQDE